jgi:hypothetical protein
VAYFPCALPGPLIFIETALRAAVGTLYEALSFSCRDILKTRAGISWKCGRILKAIIKQAHPGELVDDFHQLYRFLSPIDRLLWYFFIAELISRFVASWTSMLYVAQQCNAPDNKSADSKPGPYFGTFGGTWGAPVQPWTTHDARCCVTTPFGFDVFYPCNFSILWIAQADVEPTSGTGPGTVSTRIVRQSDGKVVAQNDGRAQPAGNYVSASFFDNVNELQLGHSDSFFLEWQPTGPMKLTGHAHLTAAKDITPIKPGGCDIAHTHTI